MHTIWPNNAPLRNMTFKKKDEDLSIKLFFAILRHKKCGKKSNCPMVKKLWYIHRNIYFEKEGYSYFILGGKKKLIVQVNTAGFHS